MQYLGYQIGTIGFVTVPTLLRLARYVPGMSLRRLPRLALVVLLGVAAVPLRLAERLRWGRRVRKVRVAQPPVFIIGHWRSGTTHLHNLMAQDPAFGCVSMYQAMIPGGTLIGGGWLKRLLARIVPEKRPMDQMVWPVDAPQEEEIPLGKCMPYSFYVQFLFPRRARHLFRRYVMLEGAPARAATEWKRTYARLMQVATLHAGGRRLLLKNPVNTARIRLLLELYPDAKFVHIARSPYAVYPSTKKLHHSLLRFTSLETVRDEDVEATVLDLYDAMMRRYLEDRALVPDGNLVEVRFEDLERDPLRVLRKIYADLDLPGFGEAEGRFRTYAASQAGYRKNEFSIGADTVARLDRRWGFAFEAFGYRRRGESLAIMPTVAVGSDTPLGLRCHA